MTEPTPSAPSTPMAKPRLPFGLEFSAEGLALRILLAVLLSILCAAALIAAAGHDPISAFAALIAGAVGTPHQVGVGLNRTTPYLLAGAGVALCFRAGVINIGAEGQIAVGGIGGAAAALAWPAALSPLAIVAALVGGALAGALWSAIATAIYLGRHVHEVLVTLLLNFVALLLVQQVLAGPLGQTGAGFLQSPLLPRSSWLPRIPGLDAHPGFIIAGLVAAALSFLLWRTPFGFALRVAGSSRKAAAYAGFSIAGITWGVMLLAGALAGLAGAIEVIGVHHRLIEGFSLGFGFKAVTVALLGALEPLAVVPAALFVGLLEAGSLSMQRQIGVPSALVAVIEGLTMLFVLAATVRRT
jgi:simple sugar transport system permease protein